MMRNNALEQIIKQIGQKRTLKRIIALLSVVVILVTFNSTKFMADTLEHVADCGYDYDHQHGPECYDASGELVCQLHVHTDACYQTRPVSEPMEATEEAPVEEAAELADLPVEEDASASVEEAVPASVGETVSEQVEEAVEEVEIELDDEAEEAEDESQFYDEEFSETEPEAVEPEHIDDDAAPETQLLFYVGDQYPFFLSDVLSACAVDVPLSEVVEIGQVLSADDAPQTLSFERIEDDYAIYTVEDCEDQELAIITETDLVTVRLIDAIVPQWVKEQTEEQTEEQTGEGEQTAVTEEQPAEEEMVLETVEADNTIEEISVTEEPAVIEEPVVTEADIVTEDTEEPIEPGEVEEVEEAVAASETEETEKIEDGEEAVVTEEPEDDEVSAEAEESEDGEKPAETEEPEDDKESAEAEESEDGEKPVETEEPENDEESAETEESEDDKESAEAEESEGGEKPAETEEPEETEEAEDSEASAETEAPEDGEEANVSDNHSLIIDLSQVESYPLSLNAMLAHFQPVDVSLAETTSTETDPVEVESDVDVAEDTEVESEAVEADVNEVEFELGEKPEAAGSVEPVEPVELVEDTSALPVLTYDNTLLAVEPSEDDYLITPIASFDRADIMVDDTWTILLLNSNVEDAVAPMPAQSFEGETDYVSVKVEAPEGAFPAETTMSLADIDDEDTLTGIGDAVAGEDFVEVQRVHAVDITFRDAEGNEIEPLIPISVIMSIRETDADEDTVVVHMDDEGNAEVVPDVVNAVGATIEATADEAMAEAIVEAQPVDAPVESVSFESDAFSVYAVVVTKKLETKIITAGDETYKITVTYTEDAAIPEGAALDVREIEGDEAEEYLTQAGNAVEDGRQIRLARFFDIRIMDGETEVQPAAPVMVTAELVNDAETDLSAAEPCAVHFTDEEPELVKANETDDAVSFRAEGFSVWGVVYTVDFHWEVDGKVYDFSIPGGYISMADIVRQLGLAEVPAEGEFLEVPTEGESLEIPVEEAELPDEVDPVKVFMSNVLNVTFSNSELAWVGKIDKDTNVGALAAEHGLEVGYSALLTQEEIDAIEAQAVQAGDWAFVSLRPFTSEETLTIAMLDGKEYVINVTDAQIRQTVISAAGDTYEITVTYDESAGIPEGAVLSATEISEEAENYSALYENAKARLIAEEKDPAQPLLLNISILVDGQEIEPADDSRVRVDVKLVQSALKGIFTDDEAPLLINDAPLTDENGDIAQDVQVLHQLQNGEMEFVETVDRVDDQAVTSSFITGSFSDWLLYLDEDVSGITICKGDTITLRPYSSWIWKKTEELDEYKGMEWNFPSELGWSSKTGDWTSNSGTGSVSTINGVITFERKSKWDGEIRERYDVLHATASNTGDFILQLKKGDTVKNITVHVRDSVSHVPAVITNTADIKVNLFDYDYNASDPAKSGNLDNSANTASIYGTNSNDERTYNTGVNSRSDLKFLGWGASNSSNQWFVINNYTKDVPNQGILLGRLNDDGYPVLGKSANGGTRGQPNLNYLFDGNHDNDVKAYMGVNGLFQRDSEGYYYYSSNSNYAYYDTNTSTNTGNKFTLYDGTYSQFTTGADGYNAKPIGFFPFHQYDTGAFTGGMNHNKDLNHHFGMSMTVDFEVPSDGLDEYGNPIIFEFSGDDDMWVFIDGNLVLDVGGIHQPVTGTIDFSANRVSVYGVADTTITQRFQDAGSPTQWEIGDGKAHTLKVFYLERGGCDSNLSLKFNTPKRYGKGELELLKRDNKNNTPLQGAVFKLWNNPKCEGEPVGTYTTGPDGKIDFGGLVLKDKTTTYYLQEFSSPEGYIRDTNIYRVMPKLNDQGEPVKDSKGEYIIMDVLNENGTPFSKLEKDVVYPNTAIETFDIPAKKTWVGTADPDTVVTLTVKRYKLVDRTKGFSIIKEFENMPEGYAFDASYAITYPNGYTETVYYSQFEDGVYRIQNAPAGNYTVEETVTSNAPEAVGYHWSHSPQSQSVTTTLEEDEGAEATFKTTFNRIMGKLRIEGNLNYDTNNGHSMDYSGVKYVIVDEDGKKVASATYNEVEDGKTFDLPIGNYSVKMVSLPKKPGYYIMSQTNSYNNTTQAGTERTNIAVTENNTSAVEFNSRYTYGAANNCTWLIKDAYQENEYKKWSGNVEFLPGTVVRMTFTAKKESVYFDNSRSATYNNQNLTIEHGVDCNDRDEFSVEFTVANNQQLVIKLNYHKDNLPDFSTPVFQVIKESPSAYTNAALNAVNPTSAANMARFAIRVANQATPPAAPENKKYIEDTVWSATIELKNGNSWQDTLRNLPATDDEGKKYYYYVASVDEKNLPEGATCTIDMDGENQLLIGKDSPEGTQLGVTNTMVNASIKIIKVRKGTDTPVTGAKFVLTRVGGDGTPVSGEGAYSSGEQTVDTEGNLVFDSLRAGRYKLEETHVPEGYVKKEAAYFITIGNDGTGTLDLTVPHALISPNSGNEFTVENEPGARLPNTGGPGTNLLYLLGGMMIMLAGAGLILINRKKREG